MPITHRQWFFKQLLGVVVLCFFNTIGFAAPWGVNHADRSGFFENTDAAGAVNEAAPYFFMSDGMRVYFGRNGFAYEVTVGIKHKLDAEHRNGQEAYEHHHRETLHHRTEVRFVNPQNTVNVSASEVLPGYLISHGSAKQQRFARVTMENVWNNIDLVLTLDDRGGFKYNVILHPGANLADVQFDYADADHVILTDGGLVVHTQMGSWMEALPISFAADAAPVGSSYRLDGNVLGFVIDDYNPGAAYTIDPWVTFYPAYDSYEQLPAPMDSVWFGLGGELISTGINNVFNRVQMDCDAVGNTYIVRTPALFFTSEFSVDGYYPSGRFVEKYDADGNLVFIFDNGYEEGYFSDITVNKLTQQIYFTAFASTIKFLGSDGTLINEVNVSDLPFDVTEVCSVEFDHCTERLVLGLGGDFAASPSFYGITDADNSGTVEIFDGFDVSESLSNYLPYNDNIDLTIDPLTGEYFFLFLLRNDFAFSDRALLKVDPANMEPMVQNSGDFLSFTELAMHSAGQLTFFRNHFNALKCGREAIYGSNGAELVRWNKTTNELLNSVSLPGFLQARAEGVDLDMNERLYVGANNQLQVYTPELSSISNIPLQGMPQDVVIFGNTAFVATDFALQKLNLDTTAPWTLSQVADSCGACVGEATIAFTNGAVPAGVSIEWLSTGSTELTQTDLCEGWHTVVIREERNCVLYQYTDSVFVETNEDAICQFQVILQDASVCEGECITLVPQVSGEDGAVTYTWSTGLVTTEPELELCLELTTAYQLIATDASGASDTAAFTLTVVPFPIVSLGNDTTLCQGETLLLNAENQGALYQWQDGSTGQSYEVFSPGSYTVSVTQSGCTSSDAIQVDYNELSIDLGPDTAVCSLDGIVLNSGQALFSNLWQDGSTAATLVPEALGVYWVEVFDGLCTVRDSVVISPLDLNVSLGPDVVLCEGDEVTLSSGLNFGQHAWSNQETSFDIVVTEPGTYWVNVTDDLCFATDTVEVTGSAVLADFEFVQDEQCTPSELAFLSTSVSNPGELVSWTWDFGDGSTSAQEAPTHVYTTAGIYSIALSVANADGCTDALLREDLVTVYLSPNAAFTLEPNLPSANEVAQFTDLSSNALNWMWDFGDGGTSTDQNPEYTFESSGTFTVTLVVENDFCSDATSRTLAVEEELLVYVPNSFTPNNDGLNDVFRPSLFGTAIGQYSLQVFNRWGDVVFETEDPDDGWLGNVDNAETSGEFYVQNGVYAWRLVVSEANSVETKLLTGHVMVIR
ncbi:MAG: PKD domain-containing protein [Flavobacteriales bacterium]